MGFFKKIFSREKKEKLDEGLEKTKTGVWDKITRAVAGKSKVDDDVLDNLEEAFVTSDVGVETTIKIIDRLNEKVAQEKYVGTAELNEKICDVVLEMLDESIRKSESCELDDFEVPHTGVPYVIMVVGVNGVGKTTTIGKLAAQYAAAGNKVVLGAADTFRAASIEQLEVWGQRANVEVVKQKMGSDPAAVAFDTVQHAKAVGANVVLIDTAGRLHNKVGLMNELGKVKKVMQKVLPSAPDEVLLVLDGSTGQNAYEQARQFAAATDVNALAVTKLDGTAKGGVVIGICDQMKIPVKYIGVGEGITDLQIFNPREFVRSLFLKE